MADGSIENFEGSEVGPPMDPDSLGHLIRPERDGTLIKDLIDNPSEPSRELREAMKRSEGWRLVPLTCGVRGVRHVPKALKHSTLSLARSLTDRTQIC